MRLTAPHRRLRAAVLPLVAAAGLAATTGDAATAAPGWTTGGPFGGPVSAVAVDPANPSIAYAVGAIGGLFRTGDAGATWVRCPDSGGARSVTFDPHAGVVFAGFSDVGVGVSAAVSCFFVQTGAGLPPTDRYVVAVQPPPGRVLYTGTDGAGVYRSTDNGTTWHPANGGIATAAITSVAVDAHQVGTLLATTEDGVVYRSVDAGTSWTATAAHASAVVSDPFHPGVFFANGQRSADDGVTWAVSPLPIRHLAPDLSESGVLYADTGTGGVERAYRSTDDGLTWSPGSLLPSASGRVAALTATAGRVYAGAGNGLATTVWGSAWRQSLRGLDLLPGRAVAVAALSGQKLVAPSSTAGAFGSSNLGLTWSRMPLPPGIQAVTIDPTASPFEYAAGESGSIYRSADGGLTWIRALAGTGDQTVQAFAVDPARPAVVYAAAQATFPGSGGGVLRSLDHGVVWQHLPGLETGDVLDVAVDGVHGGTVYAATATGVETSADGGEVWRPGQGLPARPVVDVATDPLRAGSAYAAQRDGVYASTDSGATWHALSPLHDLIAIAVDPANGTLYAAGRGAVPLIWASRDRGDSWARIDTGLPAQALPEGLSVAPDGTLVVGTDAGVYTLAPAARHPMIAARPRPAFMLGTQVGALTAPVLVSWLGHPAPPECGFQLNRVAGGERSGVELGAERAQAAMVVALSGVRQQYLVRPLGCDGPPGAWVWGPAFGLGIVSDRSPRLVAGHNWSQAPLRGAQGGTVRFATARGATMSFTFTGRAVAWVAPRRPSDGEAVVALDGHPVAFVHLNATTLQLRRIVWDASFQQVGTHRVTITVVGTPDHPRVDVDSMLVLA
jgi:photosystem II stability/assembly factor-like uncharacterized protein